MSNPHDHTDKELQELLQGLTHDRDLDMYDKQDIITYRALFEVLNEKPVDELPADFADDVIADVQARRDRITEFKWNFILAIGALVFITVIYLLMVLIQSTHAEKFLNMFFKFRWHCIFVIAGFFIIQFFDNRLLTKMHPGRI